MKTSIDLQSRTEAQAVYGQADEHLKRIREDLHVRVVARQNTLLLDGTDEEVARATEAVDTLRQVFAEQGTVLRDDVESALDAVSREERPEPDEGLEVLARGRRVRPRTAGQRHYIQTMLSSDVVFCTGPAGTGKTFLAVAVGVHLLLRERVGKIVLVRPAVEAGEKLGFLPGDIEASPLAFMRGRTLNNSMIILDEAQNTTHIQMKMFLTRMGIRSKVIVTGDTSQIDLTRGQVSGLVDAKQILGNVQGVRFVHLTRADVVSHRLVQHVVDAYDKAERDLSAETWSRRLAPGTKPPEDA